MGSVSPHSLASTTSLTDQDGVEEHFLIELSLIIIRKRKEAATNREGLLLTGGGCLSRVLKKTHHRSHRHLLFSLFPGNFHFLFFILWQRRFITHGSMHHFLFSYKKGRDPSEREKRLQLTVDGRDRKR